ncbi:hypothetical protein I4F81_003953 [Pyropia yezoensis]|uniref:Uncharacterized protein n=1 Tax=Pyropia yezoensis TaxID=2788 RepID=A0ACC3BUI1_PYRYE|nr:hypothetical protein I4F81_003953 [Neopyropia yezoensis]
MFAYSSMLLEGAPPAATSLSVTPHGGPRMTPAERLQLVSQLPVQFEGELGFKPRASRLQSSRKRGMDAVFKLRSASDLTAWSTVLTMASGLDTPCLADFEVGVPIGVGGGGRVYAVRHVASTVVHAMKVVNKRGVLFSPSTLRNAVNERLALERIATGHPFLLPLRYAFQTSDHLFLVTELCDAGDLATHLKRQPGRRCSEDDTRFLAAELILALEHIHSQDVVFRDMKPENVLLDRDGHARVADFGLASFLPSADGCANSLCGTASFLPPEMLNGKPYGIPADMWSLGVCLFRCVTGKLPWGRVGRASATFRSIKNDAVHFPSYLHPTTVSFLAGLLERKVSRRLTIQAAKAHPYFASVDWVDILAGNGPGLDVEPSDMAARFRLFESALDGPLPDFLGGTACPDELGGPPPRPPLDDDPMLFEADAGDEEAEAAGEAGKEHPPPIAAVARQVLLAGPADWAGPRVAAAATEGSLATTLVGYEYSTDRPGASGAALSVALVHRKSSADVLLSKIASIRSGG